MSNQLYILKKRDDIAEAKKAAEQEYEAFVKEFPPLNTKVERAELHEIYAIEGKVGYLIRVTVEHCCLLTIQIIREWAQEHIVCDVPVIWDALNLPLQKFTAQQQALIAEYEQKYGKPDPDPLPGDIENSQPEYVTLIERLSEAGIEPSSKGWVPAGTSRNVQI